MKQLWVYIDTSVFGGCFGEEFKKPSPERLAYIKQQVQMSPFSDNVRSGDDITRKLGH